MKTTKTKKLKGRRYLPEIELISLEEAREIEESGYQWRNPAWVERDWESAVCEALDEEDFYRWSEVDNPNHELEIMRVLHR